MERQRFMQPKRPPPSPQVGPPHAVGVHRWGRGGGQQQQPQQRHSGREAHDGMAGCPAVTTGGGGMAVSLLATDSIVWGMEDSLCRCWMDHCWSMPRFRLLPPPLGQRGRDSHLGCI